MYDIEDAYEQDVFDETEEEFTVVKRRNTRSTKPKTLKAKLKKAKEKKLPKNVVAMQTRYDALIDNPNTTAADWQDFYKSIEKFIMTHAYRINFNHYIEKTSELWGHLTWILMECIKPKIDANGNKSYWYIDPFNHKLKPGYDRTKTNIGNYLLSKIKWVVVTFNQYESKFMSYCTDLDLEPVPDEQDQDAVVPDYEVFDQMPIKLEVRGQTEEFRKELEDLWNLRTLSTCVKS